jgi:hypothetical protein
MTATRCLNSFISFSSLGLDEVDDGRALAATGDERIGDGARPPIDETAAAIGDDTAVADDGDDELLLVEGILLISINKSSRPRWKES